MVGKEGDMMEGFPNKEKYGHFITFSVREDINGKKRFLSGIARMRGEGSTFFKKCIFGQ